MTRRAARLDDNHHDVVTSLEAVGAVVQSLASMGKGCPDILVGFRGINFLFEIKDGKKPKCETKLTPDEVKWHARWTGRGKVYVVYSAEEALAIITAEQGTA